MEKQTVSNKTKLFPFHNPTTSIKWTASVAQILGYATTAYNMHPWNIYLFLVGLLGWFTVGILWNDKAIILIHLIALISMLSGLASS